MLTACAGEYHVAADWAWRQDDWFRKLDRMTPYRRVLRLKQYIIDHYEFNLDLDTWGLTTQERELARFHVAVERGADRQSNALFGTRGTGTISNSISGGISAWTDTIETSSRTEDRNGRGEGRLSLPAGYSTGAGECVSLATLYAAALFVVAACRCGHLPDGDAAALAELHDVEDGILTNNRRVVTKAMWFNGTETDR
jgi:hypothetical protein